MLWPTHLASRWDDGDVSFQFSAPDTNAAIPAYRSFVEAGISNDETYERFLQMDIDSEEDKAEKINEILGRQGSREETVLALKRRLV